MPTLNFPFTNIENYTVDTDEMNIVAGKMKLALQQDDVDFVEDFADDTDFIYDSDLAEFFDEEEDPLLLVRQKNKRPTNAIFYASFTNGKDASWGEGTLTGTLGGNASVHDGYLDLYSGGYEEFPIDNFASMQSSSGCIRKRISFDYSGAAPNVQYIIQTSPNTASRVYLVHNATFIQCYITNTGGTTIYSMVFSWTPNQGQIYEFEIDWTSTHAYIFINGQLQDSDTGSLGMAEPSLFRIGADANTQMRYYDIIVFNTLQHSSNYAPDWSNIYEYDYLGSSVILPEMEHAGDGTIKLFNSFSTTETGSPRYTLQIGRSGDYLYWNGSAWVVSNGTYDQANDATTFNTNIESLNVDGENYGQFKIIFTESNTQNSVDELTANMNVDIGYLTTNPYGKINTGFRTDELEAFIETTTKNGNDEIKYILEKEGNYYYWNGSAWVTGSLQYSNSSTASDINTNCSALVDGSSLWYIYFFLHSDDGSSTPEFDNLQVNFSYGGETPDTINTCLVWGYMFDAEGNPLTDSFNIRLNKYIVEYGSYSSILKNDDIRVTPDESGYWEVALIENENMVSPDGEDVKYIFDFGDTNVFEKTVPNETTKAYNDLE